MVKIRSLGKIVGIVLGSIFVLVFVSMWIFPYHAGTEKNNLLEFSCDDLANNGKISRDGPDGKFVKDWGSSTWVKEEVRLMAWGHKGCGNKTIDNNTFDYKSGLFGD